jgi:ferredoxin--NADP+ reductase
MPKTTAPANTHKIVTKQELAPRVKMIKVYAPEIAEKAKPGQFTIIVVDEKSERLPLTLAAWENSSGTITLIFQEIGFSTRKLGKLHIEDKILSITGPLGKPSNLRNYGRVAVVCGGVGTAAAYPIAKALKAAGNKVTSIIGAKTKEMLILEAEMERVSNEFYVSTDDGSKGYKGFVSDVLKTLIEQNGFDVVYAIGPPLMMHATAEVTRPYGIRTKVSLNSIMVCGMGMCGSCRVSVGGKTRFVCVEGPEFDAHKVNFKELMQRLKIYSAEEKLASEFHEKLGTCTCQKH